MRSFTIIDIQLPKIEQTGMNQWTIIGEDTIELSDGYHTMHELYQHRMALNAMLFRMMFKLDEDHRGDAAKEHPFIMKSKLHNDGSMFDGYFIVFAQTKYGQISYHYQLKHWDIFLIPEVERIPFEWDGHSASDCVARLLQFATKES